MFQFQSFIFLCALSVRWWVVARWDIKQNNHNNTEQKTNIFISICSFKLSTVIATTYITFLQFIYLYVIFFLFRMLMVWSLSYGLNFFFINILLFLGYFLVYYFFTFYSKKYTHCMGEEEFLYNVKKKTFFLKPYINYFCFLKILSWYVFLNFFLLFYIFTFLAR